MNPIKAIIGVFKNRPEKQVSQIEIDGFTNEFLAHQDPAVLASKIPAFWPSLDGEGRQRFRQAAREYGWEAHFLTDLEGNQREKRLEAMEVLGLLGGEASLWPLLGALAERDETLCFAAAAALKELNAPQIMDALLDALAFPERWPPARIAEIILARGEEGVEPLLARLAEEGLSSTCQGYMIELLGALGDERAFPYLVTAMGEETSLIRAKATEALARLRIPLARKVDPLLESLWDEAWEVRVQGGKALGNLGIKAGAPFLQELQGDPDWRVREIAKKALAQL